MAYRPEEIVLSSFGICICASFFYKGKEREMKSEHVHSRQLPRQIGIHYNDGEIVVNGPNADVYPAWPQPEPVAAPRSSQTAETEDVAGIPTCDHPEAPESGDASACPLPPADAQRDVGRPAADEAATVATENVNVVERLTEQSEPIVPAKFDPAKWTVATQPAAQGARAVHVSRRNDWKINDKIVEERILNDAAQVHFPDEDLYDESDYTLVGRTAVQQLLSSMLNATWRRLPPRSLISAEGVHLDDIDPEAAKIFDALPPEKQNEILVESARHRAEVWSQYLYVALSIGKLRAALDRHRGYHRIALFLSPYAYRKVRTWHSRAARQSLCDRREHDIVRPTPEDLRSTPNGFFAHLTPNGLKTTVEKLRHKYFREGEYVFHAGDYSNDMYLVARGTVEIVIIDGHDSARPKSKGRNNGTVVATLGVGDYFGECAMVTLEQRSASVICTEDTDLWQLAKRDFVLSTADLSPTEMRRFEALADERRTSSLQTVFPLSQQFMGTIDVFAEWNAAARTALVEAFHPIVARAGSVLFSESDDNHDMFYIHKGLVEINRDGVSCQTLHEGETFGAEGLILPETNHFTARCVTPAEMWVITRERFLPVAMEYALCTVTSRDFINRTRAMGLRKPVGAAEASFVFADPVINYLLPPTVIRNHWVAAEPFVASPGDILCRDGGAATAVIAVKSGTLHVRYAKQYPHRKDEHVVVKELPKKGVVFGAVEIAIPSNSYVASVRCTSVCEGWKMPRMAIEAELERGYPLVWAAIQSQQCRNTVTRLFAHGTIEKLNEEAAPPRNAGNYRVSRVYQRLSAAGAAWEAVVPRPKEKKSTLSSGSVTPSITPVTSPQEQGISCVEFSNVI